MIRVTSRFSVPLLQALVVGRIFPGTGAARVPSNDAGVATARYTFRPWDSGGITKGARAQVRLEPKRRDEAKPSRKGEWTSSSPIAALLLLAVVILGAVGAARENMALCTMAFFGGLWSPALGLGVRYIRQGRLGLEAPVDVSVLVVADAHPNLVRAVEDGRAGGLPASAQPYEH